MGIDTRRGALVIGLLLLGPVAVPAAESGTVAHGGVPDLIGRVRVLTAPAYAGREAGSREADAVADTLALWMGRLGLRPGLAGEWFQSFPLTGSGWTGNSLVGRTARNVVGMLPGKGPLAGRALLVGAHYDHLGRVDPTVDPGRPPARGAYYPGANDNASGVTIMLSLARDWAREQAGRTSCRTVYFVAFCGEEVGLQGSGWMVEHLPAPRDSLDAMLNFDTVGLMTDNRLYVSGVGTSPQLEALVAETRSDDPVLSIARGGFSGSDHMSFATIKVPVLFFFAGPYPQYNRPSDDWDILDVAGMTKIAGYAGLILSRGAVLPGHYAWTGDGLVEKPDEMPSAPDEDRATWLGTLPDFAEGVVGYKLGGVFPGSPAARAGLQKGDILTAMGGEAITDLATFTTVLRSHHPGDLVEMDVTRDGGKLKFTVVLGNRSDRK